MPSHRVNLLSGTLYALAAGLIWGGVFVAPLLLPQYPPALLSFGRYLAFGVVALPLAWLDRKRLLGFQRADWVAALKLAAVGNLAYYLLLSGAIQHSGAPLPTMLIGTLPVVIALFANRRNHQRDGRVRWRQMLPGMALIGAGVLLVNQAELAQLRAVRHFTATGLQSYVTGAVLALGAVACWTWYPLRNADWLRDHPGRSPTTWATAQGLATLPLALLGYAGWWAWAAVSGSGFSMPLGPEPLRFGVIMVGMGLLASWLGTLLWNEASQRLPTTLAGPLIVFETLSALAYTWVLRGHWPPASVMLGVALLVAGVAWAMARRPQAVVTGLPVGKHLP